VAISTIGHGTLTEDQFGVLVTDVGIDVVVDVRRRPGSRRHPQFNRGDLERWLPEYGVAYEWQEILGGHREAVPGSPNIALDDPLRGYADHMATWGFASGLDHVCAGGQDRHVAVLCAERDWQRCHRRLVADALVLLRRAGVEHLGHDGSRTPHRPTPAARVTSGRLVYDRGVTPPLLATGV
jgi:uncharacterized protein (DUF488 family)